ncbi:MAG: preprotein translocase subunit SecA, partial [Eggerthellaceae bacterium]|nr:preprotein translocase subunit SecA [Eggerthellaceae bacterium]
MGRIYKFLGMTVGLIQNGMMPPAKIPAYQADVTYGTNSEFGFDYLRDNMVTQAGARVQRGHHFAIVDEVDSILIDEARTPLIISGAGMQAASTYQKFARVMPGLREGEDFEKDEAKRTITCTETGLAKVENMLGIEDIYADPSGQLANHLQQALRAQFLYHRDIDYVVVNGEVKIVDEFTGRIMEGRRWSEGLHQAVEAKEHVQVRQENQTLATITLQNYFRLYKKLSGMTGTAMTQDAEFREVYKLPVVAIPPNKPVIRVDEVDQVYRTIDAKFNAVADDITERHAAGQPVLVGTVSIESSERLSRLLDKRGIPHEILNAKNHEREAHIIAQAGRVGAVTIATNMAGRGTDILLGGNPDVLMEDVLRNKGLDPAKNPFDAQPEEPKTPEEEAEAEAEKERLASDPKARARAKEARDKAAAAEAESGLKPPTEEQWLAAKAEAKKTCAEEHVEVVGLGGLAVIGTERHESRRIDNQLRGRSGRQGDPGCSQFYLSLEDDLMRLFGGDRMDAISRMMERTQIPDDMPIQASMVGKSIETAQRNVETIHFAARKNVLEYDDVMNLQRKAIYDERNAILDGKDMTERIPEIIADAVADVIADNVPERSASDDWNLHAIDLWVTNMTGTTDFVAAEVDHNDDPALLEQAVCDYLQSCYDAKEATLGEKLMRGLESQVMLRIIDTRWMAHLADMDYLKSGIYLRAYGQRDP